MYIRHFEVFCSVCLFFVTLDLFPTMSSAKIPMVINTWAFTGGTAKAWDTLFYQGKTALDAVEAGCSECEIEQCDFTVGYGGSPDENGETTLDAMIMDGPTHDVGAVAALRRIKSAISVARKVLEHTNHTLLVGDQATKFAIDMGFKEENLSTPYSIKRWKDWKENKCQPSFWKNVTPDPRLSCGPFKPIGVKSEDVKHSLMNVFDSKNHDTIGMIAIEKNGNLACGTSTNGAIFKIPGRVGDSPIPGAGAYVKQEVGAAAATGDGDIMMRFLPSYQTVENMQQGMDPTKAAEDAILRIVHKHSMFSGAVIAVTSSGEFGAACHGMEKFPFSVVNELYGNATVKTITCINS